MIKKPKAKPVAHKKYQFNKRNIVVAFTHAALFAASLWTHAIVTTTSADRSLA